MFSLLFHLIAVKVSVLADHFSTALFLTGFIESSTLQTHVDFRSNLYGISVPMYIIYISNIKYNTGLLSCQ